MGIPNDRVKFNVGGKIFETTATTLANAGKESFFGAMVDENWNLKTHYSDEYFIDRDADCFAVLLNLLRTGELYVPSNVPEKLLYREAMFYGLLDHVRSAKWGPLDGNRLDLLRTITAKATGIGKAIRAGPHGGCCVARGNIVQVYDWMLEEHPQINLDYQMVNDIGWIDSETVVVTATERLGCSGGGMGLFSVSTGELRHRFQFEDEGGNLKGYTAGALCFNSDYKVFSSCKVGNNEDGIGVWDQVTGKQIDFYHNSPGWSFGDADRVRLQWLHGTNCLMVATLPRNDFTSFRGSGDEMMVWNCSDSNWIMLDDFSSVSIWDIRDKKMVWNWSGSGSWACLNDTSEDKSFRTPIRGLIAMEERNSICVVNEYEELGFCDWRSPSMRVRWVKGSRERGMQYPRLNAKLALRGGQLFLSMGECKRILVFSGPELVLTSRLQTEGAIRDISVGGERLFVLHEGWNEFDIWETPRPPIF